MRTSSLFVFALIACMASTIAIADTRSFRCKNDLVKLGDSKASALAICGEPVIKDSFCKKPDAKDSMTSPNGSTTVINNACESVDDWTYNPGAGQFMTTLRFESGTLISIRYGERVR